MYLTLLGRISDGLVLATSVESEPTEISRVKYVSQAKLLLRKRAGAPERQSIRSEPYTFHCLARNGVTVISICERDFPRKMVFAFLDDIHTAFFNRHGHEFEKVARPYHFIDFAEYIASAKRRIMNEGRTALVAVDGELRDVTRIMVSNIEDVIKRGESLDILDDRSHNLMHASHKYLKYSRCLARRNYLYRIVAFGVASLIIILILRFFVFV